MRIRLLVTDLDGTLIEPDGSVRAEARATLAELAARGIPVCPVTSKTPAELGPILAELGLVDPAGFENGAGVRHNDGTVELLQTAVPVSRLRQIHAELRSRTGIRTRSVEELTDPELATITLLSGQSLRRIRQREATLPLVVDPAHDEALRSALPGGGIVRLIRGNRFLHLQGDHDKADVVPRLIELSARRDGSVVACGDSPNDAGLLAVADIAVVVPSELGPNAELVRRFPNARWVRAPHGLGWAAAVSSLLGDGL